MKKKSEMIYEERMKKNEKKEKYIKERNGRDIKIHRER